MDLGQLADVESDVIVVAHSTTREVAEDIVIGMGKLGIRARFGPPEPSASAVVLVLSRALLETTTDLEDLVLVGGPRLVPVTVQSLDGIALPEALAKLNWIPWNPAERGSTLRMIASACTTDLGDFHALQSLIARAEGWVAGGRSATEVVNTPKLLSQLRRGLGAFGFEKVPSYVLDFMADSAKATRAQTRRRRLRGFMWCAMAALLVWGGLITAGTLQYIRKRQQLDLVVTAAIDLPSSKVQMTKFAGLIQLQLNHGDEPSPEVVQRLIQTFAIPDEYARLQKAPSGESVNAVALGPRNEMLLADGGGSLWKVTGPELAMEPSETQVATTFVSLAAVPDLSTWAASSSSEVLLNQGKKIQKLGISGATDLVVTPDGRFMGAFTGQNFEVWQVGPGVPRRLRSIPLSEYLGSGISGGQLTVVVHDGHGLAMADAVTGEVSRRIPDVTNDFSVAAVGEGGEVVVQGADHRLWLSAGESFRSLGVPVQDIVTVLTITSAGQLIYANKGESAHLIDLRTRAKLSDVCTEAAVQAVTLSPDGHRLVCDYGIVNTIWELSPLIPGPPSRERSPATSVAADGFRASLIDSSLLVEMPDGTTASTSFALGSGSSGGSSSPQPLRGRPVTLALAPDGGGVALGSDAGDIVVADISPRGTLNGGMQWHSPDGSAIRSLQLSSNQVTVYTTTGTWVVPACVGCTGDTARLLEAVRRHLMPCYTRELVEMLGRDISDQLGIVTCAGG